MTPYLPLFEFNQFIIWKLVPGSPKPRKVPCDLAGNASNAHDPLNWVDFHTAHALASEYGTEYGVGFVFTENDPFWVLDIDKCLQPDNTWSPLAMSLISAFNGCLVEVSTSGTGLHIMGRGVCPPHGKKNTLYGIELYTSDRFIALGHMESATGSAGTDATHVLPWLVSSYFTGSASAGAEWTDGPCEEWNGITDDAELIESMVKSRSGASMFGGGITPYDLWYGVEERLAFAYPSHSDSSYDRSSADAALAQHLAFWTGKDCERMDRLMRQSALYRDKYEREDYLYRTILRACGLQQQVYGERSGVVLDPTIEAAPLKGSDKQVAYAESIRAEILNSVTDQTVRETLAAQTSASLWINNRTATAEQLVQMVTPSPYLDRNNAEPVKKSGMQYITADQQIDLFKGCTYIIPLHKVFSVYHGAYLRPEQFNATFGGYLFQLDDMGDKTTKKAWEAFTESQVVAYPKADGTWFRPDILSGELVQHEGFSYVNTYVPIQTDRMQGDVTPFWNHLCKLFPIERDRKIVLSYMAACVQHKGVKFQWCPVVQGVQGNGKSLLNRCLAFAIGSRYTSWPPAGELTEKFNSWLFGKLFIAIEDIKVSEHKQEVLEALKPMITNERLSKRAMQRDREDDDNYANFFINTNHKDALKVDNSERRFAFFYNPQQSKADLERDAMTGDYFPQLYFWLKYQNGYAIVNEFLHTYPIDAEFNPAGACQRAPETSSTGEALEQAVGSIETLVLEAIEEGTVGMMNGWVSSIALERVLKLHHVERFLPVNKRRAFMEKLGYVKHPNLHDGRVNCPVLIDENKKPRLYILQGHPSSDLTQHSDIVDAYLRDQSQIRF